MLRRFLLLILLFAMPAAASAAPTILVFGDSLSAGYGIALDQSWPSLLSQRLAGRYQVANASISGETTAGGRARLQEALTRTRPRIVIIALGANDGLRGLPIRQMRDNLAAMIQAARAAKAQVLLIGMKLPPNYGDYARQFEQTFAELAKTGRVALLPFLLEPIALDTGAYQADGLHPTAAVQPKLLDHVWPALQPLLK